MILDTVMKDGLVARNIIRSLNSALREECEGDGLREVRLGVMTIVGTRDAQVEIGRQMSKVETRRGSIVKYTPLWDGQYMMALLNASEFAGAKNVG
jgi:hypothetical protein